MKHLRKFRESSEANEKQLKASKIERIRAKTSQDVNETLLATLESQEANRAAMARQMAKENEFETFLYW